ncbi:protein-glutamate O-methyltransferase CheR [Sphingobium sufflavum]|uniref:CheR family methyltransferase n=1 Tax=Sphingobium sufflavum TaxID=1129547 RepID=UPI001F241A08|nr:protein-glutamate O-methyltransferase CheR [Sphingobium sufflavum]MCE7798491.1 protein-glutamate O-methyltransferase CheR [Sphingobium sufflavum]
MTALSGDSSVRAIADFFEQRTGQHLGESRMWRIETVLRDVMRKHGLGDLHALHARLQRDPYGELAAGTIHCIMNHESSFFRDLNVFESIEKQILPHLNRTLPEKLLRIWCAGCSTGQEAYSLAIVLKRQEHLWKDWRVSILGTDISPFSIEKAQAGVFQQMDVQRGLPIADLLRWFEPNGDQWRIAQDLRALTSFKVDNILDHHAITGKFDLILCRNVLLYFSPELRAHALSRIARLSRPDTLLILGAGETTIGTGTQFVPSGAFRGAYDIGGAGPAPHMLDRLAG